MGKRQRMAILKSKDEKEMILTCDCGCDDGIHFQIDKDSESDLFFCMTYLSANWYKEQQHTFWQKLKKIAAIIRGKDYYYSEICMTKEQFQEFQTYINQIERKDETTWH